MHDTIILNIRAIADANVVHVSAQNCITPNGRLLAKMNVTNYLRADINIGAVGNLRMNAAKGSDHVFGENSSTNLNAYWIRSGSSLCLESFRL
jgi:hypothetical protein